MDLEELKKEALEKAANAKNLAKEAEDLKKELGAVCEENARKLYVPFQEDMNSILSTLCSAASQYPNFSTYEENLEIPENDRYAQLVFYVDSSGVRLRYEEHCSYAVNFPIGAPAYWKEARYYHWARMAEWFKNEDAVNKVIEKAKVHYVKLLEKYNVLLENEGHQYTQLIEHLKELLSDAHNVEEKEDGIVEIQLGGKTYVGKLKKTDD